LGILALATLSPAGCRPAAPARGPTEAQPTLAPTPTYTATEAAFAANLNAINGLPAAAPAASARALAFAASTDAGQLLPTGAAQAELVVESAAGGDPGFTLVTLQPAGARPDIGPLAAATWRDLVVASSLGAELTAATAPPALRQAAVAAQVPLRLLATGRVTSSAAPGNPNAPRWGFAEATPTGAEPLQSVSYDAPGGERISWRHDPLLGGWQRWNGELPALDPTTQEPLQASNVVLLSVSGEPKDGAWWTGRGDLSLLRDGQRQFGSWVRTDAATPVGLLDGAGLSLSLKPGNTWWVLVPDLDAVEFTVGSRPQTEG
jgi:hypothetical protein